MFVEFAGVSKRFGERQVLDEVSFRAVGPAMVGLVGPSGAGKSTVLGMIAGMEASDRGHVRTSVETSGGALGWIVQSSPLLTRRTVWDNVALGGRCLGFSPDMQKVTSILERLRIDGLAQQKVKRLSRGERQRVAVARGLVARAEILLADEPTASLDAVARDAVTDALKEAGRSCLVLVATHDPRVAAACDVVFKVDGGAILDAR